MSRHIRKTILVLASAVSLLGVTAQAHATVAPQVVAKSAKITANIQGAPIGAKVLAVTSSGSSSFGTIRAGVASINLPKSKLATVTFSLHLVTSKKSYAGSISFGKANGSATKWYSTISVKPGDTVALPKITFNKVQKWGAVKLASNTAATPVKALVGASSTGKPKGAGRLGLGTRPSTRSSAAVSARSTMRPQLDPSADTAPGDDLDADGLPNSLDIDDNGNGLADTVDKSTSNSGSSATTTYDAFSSTDSGVDSMFDYMFQPNNYNIFRDDPALSDPADLLAHISLLAESNFRMTIRAVAPFFIPQGTPEPFPYITAAWVDCTGLAWCITEDTVDAKAPRILSVGNGDAESIWSYAYGTSGSPCNVHGGDCTPALWSEFSMKNFVTNAKLNGNISITDAIVDRVGPNPGGFGLLDAYILNTPGSGPNKAGFDLGADINPHGGDKLTQNLKPGDVFTINASLSDGSTTSIAMTISPYYITAPTVTSITPNTGADSIDILAGYSNLTDCQGNGDGCVLGAEQNPFYVGGDHKLEFDFWRPQRLNVPGIDTFTEPLVDMGGLDYGFSLMGDSGSYQCNASYANSGEEASLSWTAVSGSKLDHDPTSDAAPNASRTVHAVVDLDSCVNWQGTHLDTSDTSTKFNARFEADSQPHFGGQRGNTMQTFYLKFS